MSLMPVVQHLKTPKAGITKAIPRRKTMGNHDPVDLSEAIENYGLARNIAELDETGLTLVPQSTLGQ
jgi:hypothetical protein